MIYNDILYVYSYILIVFDHLLSLNLLSLHTVLGIGFLVLIIHRVCK